MGDRFRIDASTTFRGHYKQPLENDTLGQWDLVDPKTGQAREAVVTIEWLEIYKPAVARTRKTADGRRLPEKLNKYLVGFVAKRKPWICGPASQQIIAALYGNEPQKWIGKQIKLWVDPNVTMGRARVGGIRPREDRPASHEAPTSDPLDNEVDSAVAEKLAEARDEVMPEREPGQEG